MRPAIPRIIWLPREDRQKGICRRRKELHSHSHPHTQRRTTTTQIFSRRSQHRNLVIHQGLPPFLPCHDDHMDPLLRKPRLLRRPSKPSIRCSLLRICSRSPPTRIMELDHLHHHQSLRLSRTLGQHQSRTTIQEFQPPISKTLKVRRDGSGTSRCNSNA